ncbi:MAG: 4Fe-4S binding protein [Eubacteriales bacterium]|nr:4Fe-4S binding protein [Eubacteriales bacterium]
MIRKMIQIDEAKCNGCGACANACHEGAITMVNGKAKLIRDDYCDGLGNCLPACPTGAISFVEREAAAYDQEAVQAHLASAKAAEQSTPAAEPKPLACGCPGTHSRRIERADTPAPKHDSCACSSAPSRLSQWPVQMKLVPVNAPYFNGARLLVAADCTAYARADFHERFIQNHVTLIGCPKLDMTDYAEKLTEILRNNEIKSITVVRMEVPCCGGIEHAVKAALQGSGKMIPWQVVTIGTDGEILD